MVDSVRNSILNFDSGISRVVWDPQVQSGGSLPDRRELAPTEIPTPQQLDRLLLPENVETSLLRAMRPSVQSPDVLRPDRFEDGLRAAGRAVERAIASVSGEDQKALQQMQDLLKEHEELQTALHYYRDMLIAG